MTDEKCNLNKCHWCGLTYTEIKDCEKGLRFILKKLQAKVFIKGNLRKYPSQMF